MKITQKVIYLYYQRLTVSMSPLFRMITKNWGTQKQCNTSDQQEASVTKRKKVNFDILFLPRFHKNPWKDVN